MIFSQGAALLITSIIGSMFCLHKLLFHASDEGSKDWIMDSIRVQRATSRNIMGLFKSIMTNDDHSIRKRMWFVTSLKSEAPSTRMRLH